MSRVCVDCSVRACVTRDAEHVKKKSDLYPIDEIHSHTRVARETSRHGTPLNPLHTRRETHRICTLPAASLIIASIYGTVADFRHAMNTLQPEVRRVALRRWVLPQDSAHNGSPLRSEVDSLVDSWTRT